MPKNANLHSNDLKDLTSIITDASIHITDLAEELSHQIVHPPFLPSTPLQKLISSIAGLSFHGVRLTTKLISRGIKKALTQINSPLLSLEKDQKEIGLAILNGVIGDYLVESNNTLAIPMQLRYKGLPLAPNKKALQETYPTANGKILLVAHGLCMTDTQWNFKGHNHAANLVDEFGFTAVYLNYNGGLHISDNGKQLNVLLEELTQNWPVPISEIVILTHSMGGLISRSAIHYAEQTKSNWPQKVTKLFFLGTPHLGAPLERIGNYVDRFLGAIPYLKPFARIGKLRSAGITDLRYSNLIEEDWMSIPRFEGSNSNKKDIPLPQNIECFSIAACIGKEGQDFSGATIGDGLVQMNSALGKHKDKNKCLDFLSANTFIAYETNHLDLLTNEVVYQQLTKWISK